ncbi:MAG TPA: peptidoglycan DD-metalloendopeptidase family protein [Candidatus Limnocylindrales bacterium]
MSYAECMARISQLDSLISSVDPNWAKRGYSLASSSSLALNGNSPFAGVLESVSNQATASQATSSATMAFSSPLASSTLTQSFGPTSVTLEPSATVNGVTYAHYHNGIDMAAPLGSPVYAAASGTVTIAGKESDGAIIVKIQHDDGYSTLYGHLDPSLAVSVGQHVEAGQALGKIGLTGVTTGPHLHFGLYNAAGTAVDPSPFLSTGFLPDPTTLMAPTGVDGAMTQANGSQVLARFDANASKIPYAAEIRAAAIANGIDPSLLAGLVYAESSFNPKALSNCGASGLTQLMPDTARGLGVTDIWDVQQNLNGGAKYISTQIKRFGRVDLALAAYNAGPGAIAKLGVVPDSKRGYVNQILWKWSSYQEPSA